MHASSENDLWRSIRSASRLILNTNSNRPVTRSQASAHKFVPPVLELTIPKNILPVPHPEHLSQATILSVTDRVKRGLEDLRRVHLDNYEQTCKRYIKANQATLATEPARHFRLLQAVCAKQRTTFQSKVAQIQADCLAKCHQAMPRQESKRTPFNAEYTPLLEKYFEYNAYPSVRDRERLARKSMMTPRQIEVWFQNHRSRAKKEGRPLQKPSVNSLPLDFSLDSLEETMAPLLLKQRQPSVERLPTPPPEQVAGPSRQRSVGPVASPPQVVVGHDHPIQCRSMCTSVLDSTFSPPHAYPTIFAEAVQHEASAFPCKSGVYSFPPPCWAPRAKVLPRKECSISDLCDGVKMLHITGPSDASRTPGHQPWFASRCIGRIVAPHCSLIQPASAPTPTPPRRTTSVTTRPSPSPTSRRRRRDSLSSPDLNPSSKRRRLDSSYEDELRLPSALRTKSLSRMSSCSSLSSRGSWSELDTPETSPQMSSLISLPAVAGMDDFLPSFTRPRSPSASQYSLVTPFDAYASLPKTLLGDFSLPSRPASLITASQ
uniref:Homeodomain type 2 mating protein a2-1 n=1 Tax=Coprinopsis scobicola TaxID=71696 RepID=Q9C1N5_COPSC|nr:homeodomain type 2 mating protein a2-1 [Coprinopsis scobicola]